MQRRSIVSEILHDPAKALSRSRKGKGKKTSLHMKALKILETDFLPSDSTAPIPAYDPLLDPHCDWSESPQFRKRLKESFNLSPAAKLVVEARKETRDSMHKEKAKALQKGVAHVSTLIKFAHVPSRIETGRPNTIGENVSSANFVRDPLGDAQIAAEAQLRHYRDLLYGGPAIGGKGGLTEGPASDAREYGFEIDPADNVGEQHAKRLRGTEYADDVIVETDIDLEAKAVQQQRARWSSVRRKYVDALDPDYLFDNFDQAIADLDAWWDALAFPKSARKRFHARTPDGDPTFASYARIQTQIARLVVHAGKVEKLAESIQDLEDLIVEMNDMGGGLKKQTGKGANENQSSGAADGGEGKIITGSPSAYQRDAFVGLVMLVKDEIGEWRDSGYPWDEVCLWRGLPYEEKLDKMVHEVRNWVSEDQVKRSLSGLTMDEVATASAVNLLAMSPSYTNLAAMGKVHGAPDGQGQGGRDDAHVRRNESYSHLKNQQLTDDGNAGHNSASALWIKFITDEKVRDGEKGQKMGTAIVAEWKEQEDKRRKMRNKEAETADAKGRAKRRAREKAAPLTRRIQRIEADIDAIKMNKNASNRSGGVSKGGDRNAARAKRSDGGAADGGVHVDDDELAQLEEELRKVVLQREFDYQLEFQLQFQKEMARIDCDAKFTIVSTTESMLSPRDKPTGTPRTPMALVPPQQDQGGDGVDAGIDSPGGLGVGIAQQKLIPAMRYRELAGNCMRLAEIRETSLSEISTSFPPGQVIDNRSVEIRRSVELHMSVSMRLVQELIALSAEFPDRPFLFGGVVYRDKIAHDFALLGKSGLVSEAEAADVLKAMSPVTTGVDAVGHISVPVIADGQQQHPAGSPASTNRGSRRNNKATSQRTRGTGNNGNNSNNNNNISAPRSSGTPRGDKPSPLLAAKKPTIVVRQDTENKMDRIKNVLGRARHGDAALLMTRKDEAVLEREAELRRRRADDFKPFKLINPDSETLRRQEADLERRRKGLPAIATAQPADSMTTESAGIKPQRLKSIRGAASAAHSLSSSSLTLDKGVNRHYASSPKLARGGSSSGGSGAPPAYTPRGGDFAPEPNSIRESDNTTMVHSSINSRDTLVGDPTPTSPLVSARARRSSRLSKLAPAPIIAPSAGTADPNGAASTDHADTSRVVENELAFRTAQVVIADLMAESRRKVARLGRNAKVTDRIPASAIVITEKHHSGASARTLASDGANLSSSNPTEFPSHPNFGSGKVKRRSGLVMTPHGRSDGKQGLEYHSPSGTVAISRASVFSSNVSSSNKSFVIDPVHGQIESEAAARRRIEDEEKFQVAYAAGTRKAAELPEDPMLPRDKVMDAVAEAQWVKTLTSSLKKTGRPPLRSTPRQLRTSIRLAGGLDKNHAPI